MENENTIKVERISDILKPTSDDEDGKVVRKVNKKKKISTPQIVYKNCEILLTKGKRKGLTCNRKIITEGDEFCKFHLGKSNEVFLCNVILTKGERKNQTCNRKAIEGDADKLCKIHRTLEDKKPKNPYTTNEFPVQLDEKEKVITSKLCILKLEDVDVEAISFLKARSAL
jgi:hypothetical protein